MSDNAVTHGKTTTIGALTAVLAGCLVTIIASTDLDPGLRYSLGAVVTAAILLCAYRLGSALRSTR